MYCAFFKQGLCKKGDKCKFSHDPAVERKSAKRNIYADERDGKENENMDDWDDETLADVIAKKHGSEKTNQTEIVRLNSQCDCIIRENIKVFSVSPPDLQILP